MTKSLNVLIILKKFNHQSFQISIFQSCKLFLLNFQCFWSHSNWCSFSVPYSNQLQCCYPSALFLLGEGIKVPQLCLSWYLDSFYWVPQCWISYCLTCHYYIGGKNKMWDILVPEANSNSWVTRSLTYK